MKTVILFVRQGHKGTAWATARNKAVAANRKLTFRIYPKFCNDDFWRNRAGIVLILHWKEGLRSSHEELAHEPFTVIAAWNKLLLFLKQQKRKRELYEVSEASAPERRGTVPTRPHHSHGCLLLMSTRAMPIPTGHIYLSSLKYLRASLMAGSPATKSFRYLMDLMGISYSTALQSFLYFSLEVGWCGAIWTHTAMSSVCCFLC